LLGALQKPPRGLDIRDDCAMEAPVSHDIQSVRAVNACGVKGLHTVMYALVEHLGQRFTAQSIIPGILQVCAVGGASG
jgi:hypothetical protein